MKDNVTFLCSNVGDVKYVATRLAVTQLGLAGRTIAQRWKWFDEPGPKKAKVVETKFVALN